MFCALTYLFGHSIYFARLRHVNPQCKHKCAFLQMKEAPNQKVQEKKPLLKFKNTKKYMCLERIWRKKCFWACRHRPLACKYYCVLLCVSCRYYGVLHCAEQLRPVGESLRSYLLLQPQKAESTCVTHTFNCPLNINHLYLFLQIQKTQHTLAER